MPSDPSTHTSATKPYGHVDNLLLDWRLGPDEDGTVDQKYDSLMKRFGELGKTAQTISKFCSVSLALADLCLAPGSPDLSQISGETCACLNTESKKFIIINPPPPPPPPPPSRLWWLLLLLLMPGAPLLLLAWAYCRHGDKCGKYLKWCCTHSNPTIGICCAQTDRLPPLP